MIRFSLTRFFLVTNRFFLIVIRIGIGFPGGCHGVNRFFLIANRFFLFADRVSLYAE